MLVLLIIFMMAAPLATVDIAVDLPRSNAASQPRPERPLSLTLRRDLSLTLGETPVDRTALGAALESATSGDREQRTFIRADEVVPYGELMAVMNLLRTAGYLKVALVGIEAQPR